jgi:hypothetical protein
VTRVERVVTLTIPPSLRLVQPVLVRAFRTESARTLNALRAYADTLAALSGSGAGPVADLDRHGGDYHTTRGRHNGRPPGIAGHHPA